MNPKRHQRDQLTWNTLSSDMSLADSVVQVAAQTRDPERAFEGCGQRASRQTACFVLFARRSSLGRLVSTTFPRFSNELEPLQCLVGAGKSSDTP